MSLYLPIFLKKNRMRTLLFACTMALIPLGSLGQAFWVKTPDGQVRLTEAGASHFARLALRCLQQEYPQKLDHVINDSTDLKSPRALHPAFYGCFDWHSCVHGHWMLARLLRLYPSLPEGPEIRQKLSENLTAENIAAEVAYLQQPNRKSFERTYGWAWLLQLARELEHFRDPQAQQWAANMRPLARAFSERYRDFLPKQTYPIRTGEHPNTAFGLTFAWDYATFTRDKALEQAVNEAARRYFNRDIGCPANWEPGGSDFLSPCLEEADLMRRILPEREFRSWWGAFLPELALGKSPRWLQPAEVSDRTDPKIVHLDGLNLSRAWCLKGIASSLPKKDPARRKLLDLAALHLEASLPHIASGDYAGEHWLASFAVYALTGQD